MTDVFLSYSARDVGMASRLVRELRLAGLDVLWDLDLGPGELVTDALPRAIAESKAFVLLTPERSEWSDSLRRETETASMLSGAGGLLVLPILLPGRDPIGEVARYRQIHVESEDDLSPVTEVVAKAVRSAGLGGPSAAGLRLSFLSTLLRTDLAEAPIAASAVLDEISRTVGSDLEDPDRQLEILEDAIAWGRVRLGPDHPVITSLKHRIADVLFQFHRYVESAEWLRDALKSATDPTDRLRASFNLGNALLAIGHDAEAEDYYQAALDLSRTVGPESAEGTALVALGTIARQRGKRARARALFEQAIEVTTILTNPSARLNALLGLCEILDKTTDREQRTRYAEEALWLTQSVLAVDPALAKRAAVAGVTGAEK